MTPSQGVIYSIVVTDQWMVCGTKETLEMRSLRDPEGDFTLLAGGSTRADFSTVYCLDYTESGGYTRLFSGTFVELLISIIIVLDGNSNNDIFLHVS